MATSHPHCPPFQIVCFPPFSRRPCKSLSHIASPRTHRRLSKSHTPFRPHPFSMAATPTPPSAPSASDRKSSTLRQAPFSFPASSRQIAKKKSWTRTNYFDVRQKKLISQAPRAETRILHGVVIYFTGVKSASQRKLEGVVWRNGGVVDKLWRRQQVTHVIADNLAASKIQKEIDASPADRSVVVSPKWLLKSVERGVLLPTWGFRVIKGIPGVKNVATFFESAKRKPLKDASNTS